MRMLVVHPNDRPHLAPGNGQGWDCIIDLGFGPPNAYCRWSKEFGCAVEPAGRLTEVDFDQVAQALRREPGTLIDGQGLDWWDLISLEFHSQFEEIARLRRIAQKLRPADEVFVSRAGFQARILSLLLDRGVKVLSSNRGFFSRLRYYGGILSRFSPAQLLQIVGDKHDTGYQLRRFITPAPATSSKPVVLLPSAYINVTRTELQYAGTLPDAQFLLVTTRLSGRPRSLPLNVSAAKLAGYATADKSRGEFKALLATWERLKRDLMGDPILSVAIRSGVLQAFPKFLRDGLRIRDAWLQVFEREPVCAVLSADETNLPTRLPLMIAQRRGLPALSCHHGALDGRYRLRPQPDGIFLVKGPMEREYLIQCGVSKATLETGASLGPVPTRTAAEDARFIAFFSDAYEVSGARGSEFYRELLPALVRLANVMGRQLVIKLHPAESVRERTKTTRAFLSIDEFNSIRFVSGPLTDELLANAAVAVTVVSTTAVECAVRGIPTFLCGWLDYSNYGYGQQFVKFGAGMRLNAAAEIADIPALIAKWKPPPTSDLLQPIKPERLEELLFAREMAMRAAV